MVEQQAPGEGVGTAGCLLRVFWMFVGFIILFFIGYFMATRPAATGSLSLSILDAIYWVLVVAMVGARYLDVHRFMGKTATGEPATAKHATRYALLLAVAAGTAWVAAHLLAPYLGS